MKPVIALLGGTLLLSSPTTASAQVVGSALAATATRATYYGELILPDLRMETPTYGSGPDGPVQVTLSVPLLLPLKTFGSPSRSSLTLIQETQLRLHPLDFRGLLGLDFGWRFRSRSKLGPYLEVGGVAGTDGSGGFAGGGLRYGLLGTGNPLSARLGFRYVVTHRGQRAVLTLGVDSNLWCLLRGWTSRSYCHSATRSSALAAPQCDAVDPAEEEGGRRVRSPVGWSEPRAKERPAQAAR